MVFITAEIGINHNGDLKIAKELIKIAKSCGCDAVKFQKRTVEKSYSKEILDSFRDNPWGNTTRDEKLHLEFGKSDYDEIDKFCSTHDVEWYASSWDIESQEFLRQYNLKHNKVSSAMLTNIELLEFIAQEKKSTFISTGMSTIDEIRNAVKIFRKHNCPFELMHTNSSYPMKNEEANLNCIATLKNEFSCNVGYSGHETSVSPSLFSWMAGADYIERHITTDRSMWGTDQAASIEPQGMSQLSGVLKKAPYFFGNGKKRMSSDDKKMLKKFKYW